MFFSLKTNGIPVGFLLPAVALFGKVAYISIATDSDADAPTVSREKSSV